MDVRRHIARDLGRGRVGLVVEVGRAVDDQRRHLNRRQRAAHVDVHVHPAQREQRPRAERQSRRARPPDDGRIGNVLADASGDRPHQLRVVAQLREPQLGLALVRLARRRPREVRSPDEARLPLEQHERDDAFGIRRCEQDRHGRAVDVPEQSRALDAGRVHHRPDVVHPLLERRHAADAVGRARAALVEADDPHAIRQLAEIVAGELLVELHRRKVEAAREDEVGRPPRRRRDRRCGRRHSAPTEYRSSPRDEVVPSRPEQDEEEGPCRAGLHGRVCFVS